MYPIFFTDHGQKEPVIFLHGYCESHKIWESFDNNLFSDYRVICPDLPGFGGSPKLDLGFSLSDVADKIKELLDDLKIERTVMIGHSLGGYITLAYAERYPDTLQGFGLFHSSGFEDSDDKKGNRSKLMEFIGENGVALFIKTFVPSLFNPEYLEENIDAVETVKDLAYETPGESVIEYARAMRDRPERLHVFRNFKNPVLFVIGDKDGRVPYEKSLEQSRIPEKAVVHILKDTGHMGMYEKQEESFKGVKKFLDRCYK
ncbi:alpha/beta fold hydrolase [Bacteroidota bacterium]